MSANSAGGSRSCVFFLSTRCCALTPDCSQVGQGRRDQVQAASTATGPVGLRGLSLCQGML